MSGNANNKQNDEEADLPHINFLFRTMCKLLILFEISEMWWLLLFPSVARDPSKRRVKPTPTADLFPLALESESEDSDFRIEDNDSDGDSDDSDSESDSNESSSDEDEDEEATDAGTAKAVVNGSETPSEGIYF